MTEVARKCKKCLLREAYPEDYQKYVSIVLEKMDPKEKVAEEKFCERMRACLACDRLQNGTCMACGCLVAIRGMQKSGKCPYQYW